MAEAYIPTSGNNKGYIKIIKLKWGTKYYRFFSQSFTVDYIIK